MRGRKRSLYGVSALAVAALAALAVAGNAAAAPWCGTVSAGDRPQVVGRPDDPGHLRDRVRRRRPEHAAGPPDLGRRRDDHGVVAKPGLRARAALRRRHVPVWPAGGYRARPPAPVGRRPQRDRRRGSRESSDAVDNVGPDPHDSKYLVYYDGPGRRQPTCAVKAGARQRAGCRGRVPRSLPGCLFCRRRGPRARARLRSASGYRSGAPCPGDSGHPCDSTGDLLYPYASSAQLAVLALDVGHDDYYAHSGSWLDLQDSAWLRHIEAPPAMLAVNPTGGGSVRSDVPGIDCDAACSVEFDAGSQVALAPQPGSGPAVRPLVRRLRGANGCTVMLAQAANVGALFAPARYRLTVAVSGKGIVTSVAASIACPGHCAASAESYTPVALERSRRAAGS